MKQTNKRRLVVLMFTDIVGYSSLTERDEQLAFELLEEHRQIFRSIFPRFGGVENKTVGDAFFIEFGSVIEAVRCAVEVQTEFFERDASASSATKLQVRIGIHLADVIDSDDDSYGDGVNIAARIEGLAEAGGICISRQVHDHIQNDQSFSTQKVGDEQLKNIKSAVTIYRVLLPWQVKSKNEAFRIGKNWTRYRNFLGRIGSSGALVLMVLAILAFTLVKTYMGYQKSRSENIAEYLLDIDLTPIEQPSPVANSVNLFETPWEYSVVKSDGKAVWETFDINNSWKYADKITGRVRLRTKFETDGHFVRPTIILGRVSGSHRVYLNGSYIGGSNHLSNIEYYSFDRKLLKSSGENELIVVSHTTKSLMPGISPLRGIGCFLGEFNQIYYKIHENNLSFHLVNSIYLAVSFLVCILCFLFFSYQTKYREYLYFGLFLFLGCIALSYYNVFLSTFLDFRFHRFLKMFGLTTSSLVLLSAYFYLNSRWKWENISNIFIISFVVFLAYVLIAKTGDAREFLKSYNSILMFTTVYSLIWVSIASFDWVVSYKVRSRKPSSKEERIRYIHQLIVITFGFVMVLMVFNSIKGHTEIFPISPDVRKVLKSIGFVYPFAFAMFILLSGSIDYLRKMRWMGYRRQRADLLLEIVPIKESEKNLLTALSTIQEKLSRFVKAQRSSIYLLESKEDGSKCLKLGCALGTRESKKIVVEEITPDQGVLGYVFRTRSALLIRDISKDNRFTGANDGKFSELSSYQTGSCMIFPLIVRDQLVGVLTVADKEIEDSFTREEFALVRVIAADLAGLICQHQVDILEKVIASPKPISA